jgi:hypothetical protein
MDSPQRRVRLTATPSHKKGLSKHPFGMAALVDEIRKLLTGCFPAFVFDVFVLHCWP